MKPVWSASVMDRRTRHGTPTASIPSGIDLVTTLPDPITTFARC